MKIHKVGIIMNGVTGRMGTNQHLIRSIDAIIKQGGVKVSPTEIIMPDPVLVGRNEIKLKELLRSHIGQEMDHRSGQRDEDPAYTDLL